MATLNANMSDSQAWVPLSEADAISIEPGHYTLGEENIEVLGPHLTVTSLTQTPPNGRWVNRAVGGSTAAAHLSGATLNRYFTDAPGVADGASPGSSSFGAVSLAAFAGDPDFVIPFPNDWFADEARYISMPVLSHLRVIEPEGFVVSQSTISMVGFVDAVEGLVVGLNIVVSSPDGTERAVGFVSQPWDGTDDTIVVPITGLTITGTDLNEVDTTEPAGDDSLQSTLGGPYLVALYLFVGVD